MIDGRPSSHMQQSGDRRALQRPETVRHAPGAPQPLEVEPPQIPKSVSKLPKKPVQRRALGWLMKLFIAVGMMVLLGLAGWFLWLQTDTIHTKIDKDKYQAVFLASGQVYFGKLEVINRSWFKLSEVYYVQSSAPTEDTETETGDPEQSSNSNMQLIKLGDEVHGPEDEMMINRDQVSILENLKPNGRVSQLIQQFKSGNR